MDGLEVSPLGLGALHVHHIHFSGGAKVRGLEISGDNSLAWLKLLKHTVYARASPHPW